MHTVFFMKSKILDLFNLIYIFLHSEKKRFGLLRQQ